MKGATILAGLFAACPLAAADPSATPVPSPAPAGGQSNAPSKPVVSDGDAQNFDLLMQRFQHSQGIPPAPGQPPPAASEIEREKARSKEFNHLYGDGAFERIVRLEKHCYSGDGCDKLAAAGVMRGGYQFVDLQNEVHAGAIQAGSPPYREKHQQIKSDVGGNLEKLRPAPDASPVYQKEVVTVTRPVAKVIFGAEGLQSFGWLNSGPLSAPGVPAPAAVMPPAGPPLADQGQRAYAAAARSARVLAPGRETSLDLQGADPGGASAAAAREPAADGTADLFPLVQDADAEAVAPAQAATAGGFSTAAPRAPAAAAPTPTTGASATQPLLAQARHSLKLGDWTTAASRLMQATALAPRDVGVWALLSIAQSRQRDYRSAVAAADAGLGISPNNVPLLDAKAYALNGLRDFRSALSFAERALALNPRDAVAHFNRAIALGGLGNRAGMLEELRAAAALAPKFQRYLEIAQQDPSRDLSFLFDDDKPSKPGTGPAALAAPGATSGMAPFAAAAAVGVGSAGLLLLWSTTRRRRSRASSPAAPAAARRGEAAVIGGHYELGRQIGAGAMGAIYEGRDRALDRRVAVKVMREELRAHERERRRFLNEARIVAKLRHPHIVRVLQIVEEGSEVYLVFEHLAGGTLGQRLAARGRLSLAEVRALFAGAAEALDYAHGQGVIHRDLKPSNIMFDEGGLARVVDFGIARLAEEAANRASRQSTVAGTPQYMAPEQEEGKARGESDVYALAICLYEALTGAVPFAGSGSGLYLNKRNKNFPPASTLASGLPLGIDDVFARAFDPAPEKRFARASDLLRALDALGG